MTTTADARSVRRSDLRPAADAVLTFLGGAGTVTGSKTLVELGGSRVLVDCGLYQGARELRRRNWEPFAHDAGSLDAVVLTHAHLDHCGYLPALAAAGFRGPVYATEGTAALARIVLLDSAHLLDEQAQHANRHHYSKHTPALPLYTAEDVERALSRVVPVPFDADVEIAPDVVGRWQRAGHILGSASVRLQLGDATSVLFSGDLGRPSHPVLAPPDPPPASDVVVVESTYGGRIHGDDDRRQLADAIRRTVDRGGSVLVPAFAVDRTEVVLHALRELMHEGAVPRVPVHVDSPMALRALALYRAAVRRGDREVRPGLGAHGDPFDPGDLHEARTSEESKRLNAPRWPCIIVSASGMATGGRVLHHLAHLLPDPRNTVLLVGFQAVGTRGRDLAEGARQVKMHGRYVPVRAEVVSLPGFSVHADADELLGWLAALPAPPTCCYVNHGEPSASEALRQRIGQELGWLAVVPRTGERVRC